MPFSWHTSPCQVCIHGSVILHACAVKIRDLQPSCWEVPFKMSFGIEAGETPCCILQSFEIHTLIKLAVWSVCVCVCLFTYRRSCFRPLCLPWCHPAASGGRSRVCSKAAWRCPSAGALQSKHRVKHTLAFTTHTNTCQGTCINAHAHLWAFTLTKQEAWYLHCGIVKQWSVCTCMGVCASGLQQDWWVLGVG